MNEISSAPIELIDTGVIVAKYQPAESDDMVVISFHHITKGSRAIWGGEFFRKNGISVIGITDYKMTWYPKRHMDLVIPHILPLLRRYKKVVAYGHSMGAYAAMKYGRELSIDLALAFSPQHSIEPNDVWKFDKGRSDLYYREGLHRGMKITDADLPNKSLVFLDWRFRIDRRHAARLPQDPRIDFVACPFVKHQPVEMLAKAKATKLLFRLVRNGHTDWRIMRALVRKARRLSPVYEENLTAYLRERIGEIPIQELIESLVSAKEPSTVLDRQIALAVGYRLKMTGTGRPYWTAPTGEQRMDCPDYTASIDQARSLLNILAPGHYAGVTFGPICRAQINEAPVCYGASPALAICVAAMKLKQYRDKRRRRVA